jgi:hypothetical protein
MSCRGSFALFVLLAFCVHLAVALPEYQAVRVPGGTSHAMSGF